MLRCLLACALLACASLVGCCSSPVPQSSCLVGPPAGCHAHRRPPRALGERVWILPQKEAGPGVLMPGPIAVPAGPQPSLP